MTKKKLPEHLKKRGPKPQGLVPVNMRVRADIKARFVKRAKELGLSQGKALAHLLDHEKQT